MREFIVALKNSDTRTWVAFGCDGPQPFATREAAEEQRQAIVTTDRRKAAEYRRPPIWSDSVVIQTR